MKKFLLLFALLLTVSAQAKDKVIDHPAYVINTAIFELRPTKVEYSKKATTVHFYVVNAKWGGWNVDEPRLVAQGDTLAFKSGRLITHDGAQVLAEEPFEPGKDYDKNVQRDSLIMTFGPLPKGTTAFDCLVKNGRNNRQITGIYLGGQFYPPMLTPYVPFKDDGQSLKPLKMEMGELSATIRTHGGGIIYSHHDLIYHWGKIVRCSNDDDSIIVYRHRDCLMAQPFFSGKGFGVTEHGINTQFPLLLIPGETLTLDVDVPAITARGMKLAGSKVTSRDCFRLGGTLADINEVLLENQDLMYEMLHSEVFPKYTDGMTFPEWSEQLWQNYETYRLQLLDKHPYYTTRQREFLQLWVNDKYVCNRHNYANRAKTGTKDKVADSIAVDQLTRTYTLADPHFKDMLLYRDGRTFYMTAHTDHLPYLEANGVNSGEVYETLKALDYKDQLVKRMNALEVLTDKDIMAAHPLFRTPLREFNDSIQVLAEQVRNEAKKRIMPTPDVTGNKMLETIVAQHPGKVVFIDLWATWCGPCKLGIKAMEPLKEKYSDSPVVFVYLTNETSPVDDWRKMLVNIHGLHYRVSEKQWEQMPDHSAIPQYYIYDPQGKRIWEQTGFDDDVLKDIERVIDNSLK